MVDLYRKNILSRFINCQNGKVIQLFQAKLKCANHLKEKIMHRFTKIFVTVLILGLISSALYASKGE